MITTKDLSVNPAVRDILPPKELEERLELEEGIAKEGRVREKGFYFIDADGRPTVLEGHNRMSIALAGGYEMDWELVPSVRSVDQAVDWVLARNDQNRRMTDDQFIAYCLKYNREFEPLFAARFHLKIANAKRLQQTMPDLLERVYTDKKRYSIQKAIGAMELRLGIAKPVTKKSPVKSKNRKVIAVIGDTQIRPGVPTFHLEWIGKYIVEKCGGKNCDIVHLGDHFDLPSLSSYDEGKRSMENRRYKQDVEAGNEAFRILHAPIGAEMKRSGWKPGLHYLLGNHDQRAERAAEDTAVLEGTVGYHSFDLCGWTMHPFLKPLVINGVHFAHYFYNQNSGKPLAGEHLKSRLQKLGFSFVQGHQQGLDFTMRPVGDHRQQAVVLGSSYPHTEDYRGPQADGPARECYWRGIAILNRVDDGMFDPAFVSLDYLAERYTGKTLDECLAEWEANRQQSSAAE